MAARTRSPSANSTCRRGLRKGRLSLPKGKQDAAWQDENTLLLSREWKPGELTDSGYAYVTKRLERGQPLSAAVEVFRGSKSDVSAGADVLRDGDGHRVR